MRKNILSTLALSLIVSVGSFVGTANATLMNVKTIEISQTGANTLQVAEVVAYGTDLNNIVGTDLALSTFGAMASASDYFNNNSYSCRGNVSNANCVIDGAFPASRSTGNGTYEGLWNSSTSLLTITLAQVSTLDYVQIDFRKDQHKGSGLYTIRLFDITGGLLDTVEATAGTLSKSTGAIKVPEPSALAILGLGLMGLVASRRFKKQS